MENKSSTPLRLTEGEVSSDKLVRLSGVEVQTTKPTKTTKPN